MSSGAGNPVAVRLARARLQLRREPDPTVRALLERGVAEDAAALGPAPRAATSHAGEAARLVEEAESLSHHRVDAALEAYVAALTQALWADDLDLAERACLGYQRLVTRRDLA